MCSTTTCSPKDLTMSSRTIRCRSSMWNVATYTTPTTQRMMTRNRLEIRRLRLEGICLCLTLPVTDFRGRINRRFRKDAALVYTAPPQRFLDSLRISPLWSFPILTKVHSLFYHSSRAMRPISRTTSALQSSYTYLLVSPSLAGTLLKCYDYPHPLKPHAIIRGYDKANMPFERRRCVRWLPNISRMNTHESVNFKSPACFMIWEEPGLTAGFSAKIWSWARSGIFRRDPPEWRRDTPHFELWQRDRSVCQDVSTVIGRRRIAAHGVGMRASRNAFGICTSPSPATQKGQTPVGKPGNSLVAVDGAGDVVLLLP